MNNNLTEKELNNVVKGVVFVIVSLLGLFIGFLILNNSSSWVIDYIYKPTLIYSPAIFMLFIGLLLIACKIFKKIIWISKISFIAFVLMVLYYSVVMFAASPTSTAFSCKNQNILEVSKVQNIFSQSVDNLERREQTETTYALFNVSAYENSLMYQNDDDENSPYYFQEVVHFSNAPFFKRQTLIDILGYYYFDSGWYFKGIEQENIVYGEFEGVNYQYAFVENNNDSAYSHNYCYTVLLYDDNDIFQIFTEFLTLDEGITFNAKEKTLEIINIAKEKELIG